MLDLLLDRLKELGLVRPGGGSGPIPRMCWRRSADLNRLELAGETVRAALEALAAAAPGWLAGVIDESWQRVYGQRIDNLRLPASETARRSWRSSTAGTATACWKRSVRRARRAGCGDCPPSRRCG